MKKLIIGMLLLAVGSVCFAGARNLCVVPKARYVTTETTITLPYRSMGLTVINFDLTKSLFVSYQGNTIEVDPNVMPILSLSDVEFTSLGLRSDGTGPVTAEVIVV